MAWHDVWRALAQTYCRCIHIDFTSEYEQEWPEALWKRMGIFCCCTYRSSHNSSFPHLNCAAPHLHVWMCVHCSFVKTPIGTSRRRYVVTDSIISNSIQTETGAPTLVLFYSIQLEKAACIWCVQLFNAHFNYLFYSNFCTWIQSSDKMSKMWTKLRLTTRCHWLVCIMTTGSPEREPDKD